ncbi:MAG: serine/threonine-protein kinase [Actinomycetota bacterium]|nr:serine/threonine-protein kinase [Actinomycetota bacterium]
MESLKYLHAGKVINSRYRLITPIGSGTLAQVYLADDIRVRKQTIVKVFDEPFRSGNDVQDDFQISLQDLARTSHPNLIKILDWGSGEIPYIVTEFLAGGDLRAMLQKDASLSVAQITLIMMEILKGTSFLHERGKVHGGLKPENVIFSLNGDLKLSDTGMGSVSAKYFSSELVTEGPYVSPELSQGGLLSPAADVYAIAAIFKELIHTKLPESKSTGLAQ